MPEINESEMPLLFVKVGVLGSHPWDFMDRLSEHYDADHIATDEIRLDMSGVNEADPTTYGAMDFSDGMDRRVMEEALGQATEALEGGHNVVYDGYLNSAERRGRVTRAANDIGGLAVVMRLRCHASKMRERVKFARETNQLPVPSAAYTRSPLKIANLMLEQIKGVMPEEPYALLDGNLDDSTALIHAVDQHVASMRTQSS